MVSNPFGMRSVAQTWCTFLLDFLFGIGIGVRVEPLSTFLDLEFGSGVDIHRIVTGQNCVFFRYAALSKGPDETTGDIPDNCASDCTAPPHQSGHSSRRPVSEVATSVLRPVSSMKTRRAGSRASWLANQSWRRFKRSGRSCSNEGAVFFECPSAPSQPDIERAATNGNGSLLTQSQDHLVDGNALCLINHTDDEALVGIEARATATTLFRRRQPTSPSTRNPGDSC
jgi:hypothetical protein